MLHSLVVASADKTLVIRCKRDTVHRAAITSKTFDEVSSLNVPNSDYAIPTTSSDELPVMRDGDVKQNRRYTRRRTSIKNCITSDFQVPDTCHAIVRSRDDESTIFRVAKRINTGLMAIEVELDTLVLNIPDLVWCILVVRMIMIMSHWRCCFREENWYMHSTPGTENITSEDVVRLTTYPDSFVISGRRNIVAISAKTNAEYKTSVRLINISSATQETMSD